MANLPPKFSDQNFLCIPLPTMRPTFITYIFFLEFMLMCVFVCNFFRIAAQTQSNNSILFRSTAL